MVFKQLFPDSDQLRQSRLCGFQVLDLLGTGSDSAFFILGPLRKLQADLPRVQITVQITQQESNSEVGGTPNELEAYVKLQNYLSELKKD